MTASATGRQDVTFSSRGVTCRAWLYRPDPSPDPAPLIVMAHGLGGVRTMRLDAFAERFRSAGYVCLVFDYRYFGDSDGRPRQLLDITAQREDWDAAIAYGRGLDGIDPDRVVLWGTSFAGGHVLVAGARNPDVAAVIAQCPFTSGPASVLAMHPWTLLKVSGAAVADRLGAARGRAPRLIDLAGRPGARALMTAGDALAGYLALQRTGPPAACQVAARVGLTIPLDVPGRSARKLACPALFAICNNDSVAPAKAALRYASQAPDVEIKRYGIGHFDIYFGDAFERTVADQLDFLRRRVPATE